MEEMPECPSQRPEWGQYRWPLAMWTAEHKWQFVKCLILRHRGEVREISGDWVEVQAPFPEEDRFHHAQFCLSLATSKEFTTFTGEPGKGRKGGKGKGDDDAGHWRQKGKKGMMPAAGGKS